MRVWGPLKECAEPALPRAGETGEQQAAANRETSPHLLPNTVCSHAEPLKEPALQILLTHTSITSIYKHVCELKGGKESERVGARGWRGRKYGVGV